MRSIAFLAVSAFLLLGLTPQAVSAPCEVSHPAATGNPSPCDGVLLPQSWAARSIQCVQIELPSCVSGQDILRNLAASCDRTLQNVTKACDESLEKCEKVAREAANISRPWYESNSLWFAAGVVTTIAAGYTIAAINGF